jgi:uncharacterized protein YecT (DUF1311 family)
MIRILAPAALLIACTAVPVSAQVAPQACPDAQTQAEMNRCAGATYARADTLLNQRYRQLMTAIGAPRRESLRVAQRAWIRFRDADCAFEASAYQGGSMQPTARLLCLADRTRKRVDELTRMLEAAEGP